MSTLECRARRSSGRLVACFVAGVLMVAACSSGSTRGTPPGTQAGPSTTKPVPTTTPTIPGTLPDGTPDPAHPVKPGLHLSAGHSLLAAAKSTPVVQGAPLDDAAIQAIVARLPEWTTDPTLAQAFNWPVQSKPAPVAGSTVDVPFPAPTQQPPVVVPSGPLHVLRMQPQGDVKIAPFVTITFDQPMVPITTLAQLDSADVPATISPALAGRWQWIGTSTLRFDAKSDFGDRLPMATTYTVSVPAGTKSANGGELASAVSFSFATPPVTVQTVQPQGDNLLLTPVFLATFDQRVVPQAAFATIVVTASGQPRAMRLATAAEISADENVQRTVGSVPAGRWIAFRPVDPLPADSAIEISIGPGTPSAEGPLPTTKAATFSGHTYSPLRVTSISCDYGSNCPPGSGLSIGFNNGLDTTKFDPATIVINPPLPGALIGASGNVISIRGATQAQTTYHVTVPAGLTDIYGQQLAAADTRDIQIGSASPVLQQFQPLTTLDPLAAHPSLSAFTVNYTKFRTRVYKVSTKDWPDYAAYLVKMMQGDQNVKLADPSWPVLSDSVVSVANKADASTETAIDLTKALGGPHGHAVVLVEPTQKFGVNSPEYWANRPTITWAQATTIGLDAFSDSATIRAWTTDLATGRPLAGVAVATLGGSGAVATDADGVATIPLTDAGIDALVASTGDDSAILPSGYYGERGWQRPQITDQLKWYVIDDRGIYRPGETVSIKGWVRRQHLAGDGELQLVAAGENVAFFARDGQGNQIATGLAPLNPLGGFDFTFVVPADANLGFAGIQLIHNGAPGLQQSYFDHQFQVEQFRRPEFEVVARNESPGPTVIGDPLTVAVDANYYAGGPLPAAPVGWQVTTSAATYSPPGWDTFSFGVWTPWWYGDLGQTSQRGPAVAVDVPCCGPQVNPSTVSTFSGTTDAGGSNYLQIDVGSSLDPKNVGLPMAVSAQASVTDVNRQAWASTTNALVHPASFYVGLRGGQTFVRRGDPLKIDAVVTTIDGKAVAGRALKVTASRLDYVYTAGQFVETPVDTQTCEITSAADPVPCTFTTATGGTYKISSSVVDDRSRSSRTELTRWVSGAEAPPTRTVEQQTVTIVPDQATYAPGATAQLLVQSPFATGSGLATITHNRIVSTVRFDVADGSAVVPIAITDQSIPSLDISVEVVGATARVGDDGTPVAGVPMRPAYATGQVTLAVSTASRTLTVTAEPKAPLVEPGAKTQVAVTVKDHSGKPVSGAEFAVIVVDEAVLALSRYKLQDPLATFYDRLPADISTRLGRQSIVLNDPSTLGRDQSGGEKTSAAATTAAPAATGAPNQKSAGAAADSRASAGAGQATSAIDVRTNFDALAVFQPSVATDAAGTALIDVPLPDNLTRYRVMVVAVAGAAQFGSAEANITARLPLMVRPSAPRFLNFGDTFELPVVVQNQTDAVMPVDVVLQADNLDITGGAGQHVSVPANDRVEVRFPVSAASVGTAKFRVAATSGAAADSATVELPVYTPSTSETFATYGVIDDGARLQPITAPKDVIPQFGGLDITTSSTSLQALTDAVLYISDYKYVSSDALASRILAIASLRDVLAAFDVPGLPSAKALNATVNSDIRDLVALQNDDGGFAYWERGRMTDPYNSIQATHALVVAKNGGFAVPPRALDQAKAFLHDIEAHTPADYSQQAKDGLSAYALNVRMLAGDRDTAKAQALFAARGKTLQLDAIAWLWPVIANQSTSTEIERIVQNQAVDTAGAVTFTTTARDDAYVTLQSDRRTDGLVLDALIAQRPQSDLIPKAVAGLLAAQTHGRWNNIQENSFILLALKRYFDTYEKQTPDFVAGIWLGGRFAGDQTFAGRSTDRLRVTIPTAQVIEGGDTGLTIAKTGTGRLYYRIGLRTAPADLHLQPLDRGFVVSRRYEAVDNPADVSRDADGTWHIKAGAKVRVRLTMEAESQRTHVALIDPLPAGLEILNPALATTPDVPVDPRQPPTGPIGGDTSSAAQSTFQPYFEPWYQTWFDHQNMRDDRAEAFSNFLPAGSYDYTYVARATTPGTFVVPPARAEEMYAPETFGRASTDKVVVAG
jgi:alpha-2-macroglobulin